MSDCDLECVKIAKPPKAHEFVGPVKIVLVDTPTLAYAIKRCKAAILGLSLFLMGAVVMAIISGVLSKKQEDLPYYHIVFCTIGFQFVMPVGILMMDSMFGPASTLKSSDRLYEHKIIHIVQMVLIIIGSSFVMWHFCFKESRLTISKRILNKDDIYISVHIVSGIIATVTAIASFVIGFFIHSHSGRYISFIHMFLGLTSFVTSTISCAAGMYKPSFVKSYIAGMLYLYYIFMFLYNCAVMWSAIARYRQ